MTTPTILIAGATGTNGREVLSLLAEKGIATRALVRDTAKAADLQQANVELVEGDLSNLDSLVAAMQGIEKVYIVTAVSPDSVQWNANFINAAKQAGVKHLVRFSGMRASSNSASEIIRQHAAADDLLKNSGLTYTIIRPNSFHQNMLWQAESIKQKGQFYLPFAQAKQSTVDVRDLAQATVNILTQTGHENKVYDFTGPDSLSFHDVADIIAGQINKPVEYIAVPVEAAEQAMLDHAMPSWNAKALAEIQGVFASGEYADTVDDLANVLGYTPKPFKTFAEDMKGAFAG